MEVTQSVKRETNLKNEDSLRNSETTNSLRNSETTSSIMGSPQKGERNREKKMLIYLIILSWKFPVSEEGNRYPGTGNTESLKQDKHK